MSTAVDLALDESARNSAGGSGWWYKRVKKTGADLGTPDTWHRGVGRVSSDIDAGQEEEQLYDNANLPFGTKKNPAVREMTIVSAQDDANTEQFLTEVVIGEYFAIVEDAGVSHRDTGGTYSMRKLRFIPVAKIAAKYKSGTPDGREPEIKIKIQNNTSAVTLGASPTVPSAITDLVTSAELDGTAADSIAFSCAANRGFTRTTCKMNS